MKQKISLLAILANIFLAGGKISIGLVSNSAAILAAGLDSLVDIFSSFIGYLGIRISSKPADENHPYGHHKFEVLAGVIITLIVLVAGLGIIYDAYQNFLSPGQVKLGYLAFGVMIFSVIVNEIMARLKIYYGKKESSVSLLSDGMHSRLDVYSSLAILLGLLLTKYWIYTDALLALLMGLYIIKGAFSIGKDAVGSLLDVSAGEEIENQIKQISQQENIEIESLKTQKKGSFVTANLEIKLANNLSVEQATKISEDLRKKLINQIEALQYIAIQIKSHQVETGFYKPEFGKSFGWQRKSRFKKEIPEAEGRGPQGDCICPKCNYRIPHQRGVPCAKLKCPNCQIDLERE